MSDREEIVRCRVCDCYIDLSLEHQDVEIFEGTKEDPRVVGDYDDICNVCCYFKD